MLGLFDAFDPSLIVVGQFRFGQVKANGSLLAPALREQASHRFEQLQRSDDPSVARSQPSIPVQNFLDGLVVHACVRERITLS